MRPRPAHNRPRVTRPDWPQPGVARPPRGTLSGPRDSLARPTTRCYVACGSSSSHSVARQILALGTRRNIRSLATELRGETCDVSRAPRWWMARDHLQLRLRACPRAEHTRGGWGRADLEVFPARVWLGSAARLNTGRAGTHADAGHRNPVGVRGCERCRRGIPGADTDLARRVRPRSLAQPAAAAERALARLRAASRRLPGTRRRR